MTKQKLIDEINHKMQNTLKIQQTIPPDQVGFWEGYYAALDDILVIVDLVDEG